MRDVALCTSSESCRLRTQCRRHPARRTKSDDDRQAWISFTPPQEQDDDCAGFLPQVAPAQVSENAA